MFVLPDFNLVANVRRASHGRGSPPDVVVDCNLAWGRRVAAPASGGTGSIGVVFVAEILLLKAGSDVRDAYCPSGMDFVECPAGTGRWYRSIYVDDIGKGFPNEHRAAVLVKDSPWPEPVP